MALRNDELSEAALHALNEILPDADFGAGAPSLLLDDVFEYLSVLGGLSEDETRLKEELKAMLPRARESLSRALAAALKRE